MKNLVIAACLLVGAVAAFAKGPVPEDYLKGKIIISDRSFPMSWTSVGSYVSTLKNMNKGTIWYDKKTGKATVQYAAFFAQPVNDVQVMLNLIDITNGAHVQKVQTEQFMEKGKRVLFNSVVFDKEDIEGNKKYLLTIEDRRRVIASGTFILRVEGPHYSGKVTFTDDDTKTSSDAH
ncbi:MAG: hypothetical protein JWM53_3775 [bacterium]|nr:hypothetical protein [bacterium]